MCYDIASYLTTADTDGTQGAADSEFQLLLLSSQRTEMFPTLVGVLFSKVQRILGLSLVRHATGHTSRCVLFGVPVNRAYWIPEQQRPYPHACRNLYMSMHHVQVIVFAVRLLKWTGLRLNTCVLVVVVHSSQDAEQETSQCTRPPTVNSSAPKCDRAALEGHPCQTI